MSGSQQLLLGGAPTVTPVDPYFYSVTSLLHGDGTNGGQNNTFLDSSSNNFTITRNGNTTQGSFSPFSQTGWSNFFDGTGDYLTAPSNAAFQFGTGDFTIECWSYVTGGDNQLFYDFRSSFASNNGFNFGRSNADGFYLYNNVEGVIIGSGAGTAATNTYVHVAVSRSGSTLRLFINGILVKTATNSTNYNSTAVPTIGGSSTTLGTPGNLYTGYISNLRVVKGTAVYTADFTVPTTPLTSISGTSLLTCQANRFLDASSNAFAITRAGDTSVQPFSPFNPITAYSTSAVGGSAYFDGSGDYLTVPDNAAFDFGSGDFTISAWVYPQGAGGIIDQGGGGASSDRSFEIYMSNASTISNAYISSDGTYQAGYNLTGTTVPNAWNFIEFTRSSGTLRLFVNGVQQSSVSANVTIFNSTATVAIGNTSANAVNPYTGYISDVRVLKGTGSATSTVPTSPLTAVTNTQLLCSFTNGAIFDNAAVADYETVGNAQISTSVKKYGTGSMYFDGTGDWLTSAPTINSAFGTGDFTVECWIYPTVNQNNNLIVSNRVTAVDTVWSLEFYNNGTGNNVLNWHTGTTIVMYASTPATINTWSHVAVVRVGTALKMYLNGTQVASATDTRNYSYAGPVQLGYEALAGTSGIGYYNGYIDDLRISKGIARYPYNFTPPTAEFPNIGGTVTLTADPYFDYTTLLLPGNGTNGAQNNTFLDSSTNAFTITRNGNTTQGTFSPFSQTGWGNYFDGTGDYLSVSDAAAFTLGTSDFCMESWVYPVNAGTGASESILGQWSSASYGWIFQYRSNKLLMYYSTNGSSTTNAIDATATIVNNAWNHIAFVRSGNTLSAYVNGVRVSTNASFTASIVNSSSTVNVGRNGDNSEYVTGYLSNTRLVVGSSVYDPTQASFTVPTTPLTAITNTSLLTCQSNRFIDNSTNAFAITRNGDVSVQAFSPFNPTASWSAATYGGSGYFDGSGDYLSVTNSNDFDTNTTFTLECWIYQPAAGTGTFFSRGGGNSSNFWSTSDGYQFILYISGGTLYWQWNNAGSATSISGTAPAAGAWHHVVVGYNGTTTRMWLDGASVGTSTTAYTLPTTRNRVYIGAETAVATNLMNGYIAGLRFVQGTDVYGVGNTSISVPTAPPTAVTNTKFLANFTNAGIYDATSKNDLETVGNAQISTTQSKFGGSSMYFDGTGDYLLLPSTDLLAFGTGDYTIEFWVRHISVTGQQTYVGDTPGNTSGPYVYKDTSNKVGLYYSAQVLTGTTTIAVNTWYFIAVSRYSGTVRLFVNGVQEASAADTTNLNIPIRYVGGDTFATDLNGYIQDLRVTKGIARYTSNFTPPTTAFLTL